MPRYFYRCSDCEAEFITIHSSEELLEEPVVLETTDILKATMSSTDSTTAALSYLVIT